MSEENVEVGWEVVDAFNRRDADAFIACLHPEVAWEEVGGFPGLRRVYRGRAEVKEWFEKVILELWESFHLEVEEFTEASDGRVFSGHLVTTRGRASGVETEVRAWTVLWLVSGKIARRRVYWSRDEALEAAGLSE